MSTQKKIWPDRFSRFEIYWLQKTDRKTSWVLTDMGQKCYLQPQGKVSQLKHLTPKTTGLGISKLWSTIVAPWNWLRYLYICLDSNLLNNNKIVKMFNLMLIFKIQRRETTFQKAYTTLNFFLIQALSFIRSPNKIDPCWWQE